MIRLFLGSFAAMYLATVACARSDASAHSANTSPATAQPSATPASANGQIASGSVPSDTISERADRGRILGDTSATVWLVMASDFECPFCKQWHDTQFATIMRDYVKTGKVRVAFLNFPLSIHPNALPAAEAAMCASVQNKFWPMHESLFATQAKWENLKTPNTVFDSLAAAAHVDMKPYHQCLAQHLTLPLIQADHDRGHASGVGSTPTFFAGSYALAGADANVAAALDSALAKAPKKPGT